MRDAQVCCVPLPAEAETSQSVLKAKDSLRLAVSSHAWGGQGVQALRFGLCG